MKAPKMPAKLYVKQEEDIDTFYFVTDRNLNDLVETEPTVISEYELVGTRTLQLVPQEVTKSI